MQDRFKFRFWNKTRKIMETFNGFPDAIGDILTKPDRFSQYVIMQCTGLKDKNGKLIFEGDVLKIVHELIPPHQSIQKIYWSEKKAGFCFRQIMCESSDPFIEEFSLQNMIDKVEVIGNIYENPNY